MTIVLTWLWQGLAVAALTVLVLRAMPWLNAATRHVACWVGLAAVLGIPLVLVAAALRDATPGLLLPVTQDSIQPAVVLPAAPDWVGVFCARAWILAVLLAAIRVAHGGQIVRRLRRRSTPFDSTREARLPVWSSAGSHPRRDAQLRLSDDLAGACALGFGRPVILVGRQLADALDDAALDQIVMHEQAHLERHDHLLQLVEAIVRAVVGWHPAVWWLSRRIDLDREAACDDRVVARTGAPRQYARALLDAAVAANRGPTAPAVVPGMSSRGSALRVRVAWLLDPRRARGGRPTPIAAMACVLPVVASLASPRLAPLVAFVDAVEHALPFPGGSTPPAVAPTLALAAIAGGATPLTPIDDAPRRSRVLRLPQR